MQRDGSVREHCLDLSLARFRMKEQTFSRHLPPWPPPPAFPLRSNLLPEAVDRPDPEVTLL